jgi:branched-chain amino acid transport system ATP-binding protein
MLRLENVTVAYGKHEALHRVSLDVAAGRTTVILGANGAGKTTLLNTIAGLVRPQPAGRILFEGRSIEAEPPHRMVAAGIALVPEGRRLFGQMTVMDNLRMGAYARHARGAEARRLAGVLAMFPRLAERRAQLANTMSGGEQQMVAIARALMSGPKLLLLDEPSLGLGPLLVKDLFAALHKIKAHGQSVVLVEQSVRQSLRLADFVYVLENGRIVRSGTPDEIEADEAIQKAYLGFAARPAPLPETVPVPVLETVPETVSETVSETVPEPEKVLAAEPVNARSLEPVDAAGGFAHPYSRSVAWAPVARSVVPYENVAPEPPVPPVPHEKEQPMDRHTMATVAGGAGFFHPFARSIAPPRAAAARIVPAPVPASVAIPPARTQKIPASGGFINPYAINPQARPDRL